MNKIKQFKLNQIWLVVIIGLVFYMIIFVFLLDNPNVLLTEDSSEYLNVAKNLKQVKTLYAGDLTDKIDPSLYTRRPLLYPLFIFLAKFVWDSNYMVIICQIGLSFLNFYFLWCILTNLKIKNSLKIISVIFYLFYPVQIIYTFSIMAEILFQSLLLAGGLCLIKFIQEKKIKYLIIFNLLLGLSTLTKPTLLFFWLFNLLFHGWLVFRYQQKKIIFCASIPILIILFWSLRNFLVTDYFHFSSIKTQNLLHYNIRLFLNKEIGQLASENIISEIENKSQQMDFKEANKFINHELSQIVYKKPFRYLSYHLTGSILFFFDPGRYDIYHFLQIQNTNGFLESISNQGLTGILNILKTIPKKLLIYLGGSLIINILVFFSFVWFFFQKNIFIEFKIFTILLIIYLALISGPIGLSRYRLAIMPFLLITLPYFIEFVRSKLFTKQNSPINL